MKWDRWRDGSHWDNYGTERLQFTVLKYSKWTGTNFFIRLANDPLYKPSQAFTPREIITFSSMVNFKNSLSGQSVLNGLSLITFPHVQINLKASLNNTKRSFYYFFFLFSTFQLPMSPLFAEIWCTQNGANHKSTAATQPKTAWKPLFFSWGGLRSAILSGLYQKQIFHVHW